MTLKKKLQLIIYFNLVVLTFVDAQNSFIEKAKAFQTIDSSIIYTENIYSENKAKQNYTFFTQTTDYLISLYLQKGNYEKSERLIKEKIQRAKDTRMVLDEANAYLQMANSLKQNKKFPIALVYYQKANDIFSKEKHWKGILDYHIYLIEFYRTIADYNEAQRQIGYANGYLNKVRDVKLLIRYYNRVAAVKNETSKPDSSIYYSKKAISFCEQINDKNSAAISYNEMGFSYKNLLKPDSSDIYYKKAEEYWRSIGDYQSMIHVMNNLAMLYGQTHNYDSKAKAESMFYDIVKIVESKKIDFNLRYAYQILSIASFTEGDSIMGLKYQVKYYSSEMEYLVKTHDIETKKVKEKYENELIQKEMLVVTNNLKESKIEVAQKTKVNLLITLFLVVLIGLVIIVIYLLIQRNKSYKILKTQNREKDVLIQEIHHRVKNNLQFIAAMIKMQQNTIHNESDKQVLNEASRRINTMSLVHEMLYNKDRLAYVSLKEYISELVSKLKELVHGYDNPIQFIQEVEDLKFNINNSVALGMITSEIISNAIKHAFINVSNPTVNISLTYNAKDKCIIYEVADNGIGMQIDKIKQGLGMRLIDIFSRQMEAEYEVKKEIGVKYIFKIPYNINEK